MNKLCRKCDNNIIVTASFRLKLQHKIGKLFSIFFLVFNRPFSATSISAIEYVQMWLFTATFLLTFLSTYLR